MTEDVILKPGNKKYTYAVGRRKSAVAQIRLYQKGSGKFIVNKKKFEDYFTTKELRQLALLPLEQSNLMDAFDASLMVKGGGVSGQADAVKLAIARALVKLQEELRPTLKKSGLITRDARVKERKKYGLKSARRAPQWSKR